MCATEWVDNTNTFITKYNLDCGNDELKDEKAEVAPHPDEVFDEERGQPVPAEHGLAGRERREGGALPRLLLLHQHELLRPGLGGGGGLLRLRNAGLLRNPIVILHLSYIFSNLKVRIIAMVILWIDF